jgi:streptomycin 6-kinase
MNRPIDQHRNAAERLADRWRLQLGEPYPAGLGGLVVRATTADGQPAVLKVITPHRESRWECRALELMDGAGAVQVLRRNEDGTAMLLERCEPGHPLSSAGSQAALDVLVGLLPRTWVPAGNDVDSLQDVDTLQDEAHHWLGGLEPAWERSGRGYPRRLLDAAQEALGWLADSQGEQVLVNQDLHGDNVLAAAREPWLMIDPKPLRGEREFAAAPVVRSAELGHSARDVRYRLDRLVAELGLDARRTWAWALAQTVAWCLEDDVPLAQHVDVATWLLAERG